MADLRTALARAGIENATTLLQSGNVLLKSNAGTDDLTDIVETTIETAFGFGSDVIVRMTSDIDTVVGDHPFSTDQLEDPRMAHVVFLRSEPETERYSDMQAAHEGPEELTLAGLDLYIHYPDGSGRSKLIGTSIEKALGVVGTARNWNTVLKIKDGLSLL